MSSTGVPTATYDSPLQRCPLCDATAIVAYDHDFRGARIARCTHCGVLFMNPQYSEAWLATYYATYIREDLESAEQHRARHLHKAANIAFVERYVRPGRFLSIGCGDGVELDAAAERGWRVEGYDVDAATTARVARRTGATIYTGDLFALPLEQGAYDCVYLDQVLEHPRNPADYLRLCRRLVHADGVVYIGVPNIRSLSSRFKTLLGKAGLKRRHRGKHYDSWHHLFYYSPATLPRLMEERFGFRVECVRGDPRPLLHPGAADEWRDAMVRRVPALDSSFVILARPGR